MLTCFGTVEKLFLFFFFCAMLAFFFLTYESHVSFFFVPFASHGPYTEKGEYKIGIGVISDFLVQTVLLDIHIIGPFNRSVSLTDSVLQGWHRITTNWSISELGQTTSVL